jgi:aryl-alcohol dehydrogenase-like predicted oxidoreductase
MRLGLGTAQFGMDYGVSNRAGRVGVAEVGRILGLAAELGVHTLDTAAAYGESEAALGAALWQAHPFRIVTKCPPLNGESIGPAQVAELAGTFARSLERLRQPSVYGLLLHRASDLCRSGGELLADMLKDLVRQGLVAKIGASLHAPAEIHAVRAVLALDIAQAAVNIVDQRLLAPGILTAMRTDNTELHARSVFLQGLLLMDTPRVASKFAPFLPLLRRIEQHAAAAGVSKLALALGFVAAIRQIDTVLIGVTSAAELREVHAAWLSPAAPGDCSGFASDADDLINPLRWLQSETLTNA